MKTGDEVGQDIVGGEARESQSASPEARLGLRALSQRRMTTSSNHSSVSGKVGAGTQIPCLPPG